MKTRSKPYQVIAEWNVANQNSEQRRETFTGPTARREAAMLLSKIAQDRNNFNLKLIEYWTNSDAVEAK